jgi:hypothetical protein
MMPTSPITLPVEQLHEISNEEALALVDALLDRAPAQKSATLRYRFSSEFQADWKAELGHALHTAERVGFLDHVWERAYSRLFGGGDEPNDVDPNDRRLHMLRADLAPATLVHCLVGTGWTFGAWEPSRGEGVDVDVALFAPDGTAVDAQVKAPDKPGVVVGHRRFGGESHEAVIAAMNHAARQLPTTDTQAKLLVVCAQRDWPLISEPSRIVSHCLGGATQLPGPRYELPREKWGVFHSAWGHVSAVVLLDLIRRETMRYGAVVLINPWAFVRAEPPWFRFGRVCSGVDDRGAVARRCPENGRPASWDRADR